MANEWQKECTERLKEFIRSGPDGPAKWQKFKSINWQKRIIIADADLTIRRISGYDFSYCYFVRVNFDNSNLSNCDFSYSIFRECTANGSNVEGSNFRSADMKGNGLALQTHKFDDSTKFLVEKANLPDFLHQGLRSMSAQACAARDWRYKRTQSPLVKFCLYLTGNGYSLKMMPGIAIVIISIFSIIFTLIQDCKIQLNQRLITGFRHSLGYFLNINSFDPDSITFFVGSIESLFGIIYFSVFTAILVTMFFGKA